MTTTTIIKLWFNEKYNLYFPKTDNDCRALFDAGWTNIPCFTPPGETRPDLNSIDQLYTFLALTETSYRLQLGNYLPSHVGGTIPTPNHKITSERNVKIEGGLSR